MFNLDVQILLSAMPEDPDYFFIKQDFKVIDVEGKEEKAVRKHSCFRLVVTYVSFAPISLPRASHSLELIQI